MGRLVITQKGRDLRRVAASIAAYAVIGILVAGALWVSLVVIVNTVHDLVGR